jgi:hypothetical protein
MVDVGARVRRRRARNGIQEAAGEVAHLQVGFLRAPGSIGDNGLLAQPDRRPWASGEAFQAIQRAEQALRQVMAAQRAAAPASKVWRRVTSEPRGLIRQRPNAATVVMMTTSNTRSGTASSRNKTVGWPSGCQEWRKVTRSTTPPCPGTVAEPLRGFRRPTAAGAADRTGCGKQPDQNR